MKSDSAYNKLNYFIGVLMIIIVIFLIAFFVFLYGNNKTASLRQKENRIAAKGTFVGYKVLKPCFSSHYFPLQRTR
jgi:hypothetical protein